MAQYEAAFDWPYPAGDVILTGDFDNWTKSIHLTRSGSGFTGTVRVPYNRIVHYKFVVDGEWRLRDDLPQEANDVGIVNNIIQTPSAPKTAIEISRNDATSVANAVGGGGGQEEPTPPKAPIKDLADATVAGPHESTLSNEVEVSRPLEDLAGTTAPLPTMAASLDNAKDVVIAAHESVNGINGPPPGATPGAEVPPKTALPPSEDVDITAEGEKSPVSLLAIDPVASPTEEAIAETSMPRMAEAPRSAATKVVGLAARTAAAVGATTVNTVIPSREKGSDDAVAPVPEEPSLFKEPSLLTSVASNVASNVGLALKSLTGIDPINPNKILIPADPETPPSVQSPTEEAPAAKEIGSAPVHVAAQAGTRATPAPKAPTSASAAVPPVTPTKSKESFKGSSSPHPSTTSFPTVGSSQSTPTKDGSIRRKRQSFFGKVKNIFSHHHNGEDSPKK